MPTSRSAILTASILAASAAHAQTADFALKASLDDGLTWHSYVVCMPGNSVTVGLFASTTGAYAFASALYQIRGDWFLGSGDTIQISGPGLGRQSPFNFGASSEAVFTTPNSFRIDHSADAANSSNLSINSFQQSPPAAGDAFSTANPALLYKFNALMSNPDGSIINLSTPLDQITDSLGRFKVNIYADQNSPLGTRITALTVSGCTIDSYTPTPGTSTLLLAAAAWLSPHRRRTPHTPHTPISHAAR